MKFNEKDDIKEMFHVVVNHYEKVFDVSIKFLHLNGPYKMPFALRDTSKAELDNLEAKGILRKLRDCESIEWLSVASFVVEPSRGMRLVTNLVQLNKVVKKIAHLFTPVGDILNLLDSRAKFL